MATNKYYELLDNAPEHLEAVARLWSWSSNYNWPTPATLFIDLIGYSEEEFGERLLAGRELPSLGYLELDLLADALKQYAQRPSEVAEYVAQLDYYELNEEEEREIV